MTEPVHKEHSIVPYVVRVIFGFTNVAANVRTEKDDIDSKYFYFLKVDNAYYQKHNFIRKLH